ncbi:MAG: acyl carrier protein [Lachnospiraceae bacterium]|nr:acyl carrier protein [Lachnospiraceae bacterium]
MSRDEVFKRVTEIARAAFELEELNMTDATTANDVDEWDSFTHMSLISDIEREFHVTFSLDEISNPGNVEELVDALMRHIESHR